MLRTGRTLVGMMVMALAWLSPLYAQEEPEKVNSNLATILSVPLNPTARFANIGWGFVAGAGYNISERHSVIGEFMWNRLYSTNEALQPIRMASSDSSIDGHSDLYAVTGNYRFELRGKKFGTYFIAGGGWYYRNTSLSRQVTVSSTTTCEPAWIWWGYTCVSGTVTANQALASSSSSAFGVNGGIGFTVKVAEPSYRFYIESRYHYAPTNNINTQLIPITVGIRY